VEVTMRYVKIRTHHVVAPKNINNPTKLKKFLKKNLQRFVSFVRQNISMKRPLGHFVADMNITPTTSNTGC